MEEWKFVPTTDEMIQVSSDGRIRSRLRGNWNILKATPDRKGYLRIKITIHRVSHTYKVHRLVAEAFVPNPKGLAQVNHKDGDRTNNSASNLEWCSNQQNVLYSYALRHGDCPSGIANMSYSPARIAIGKKRRYLNRNRTPWLNTNQQFRKSIIGRIGDQTKRFDSVSDAERYIGSRHITDVLKGKRQRVKGWTFEYAESAERG